MKLIDIIFESVVDMEEGRKSRTKDEFVQEAIKKWNGKYKYDNVDYEGSNIKVMITCPLHGDFPQSPKDHLSGKEGCKKCYSKRISSNTEDFIKKAQKIHFLYDEDGNKIPKYTYDNVDYKGALRMVNITCPLHGDFPQTPNNHLAGYEGCDTCYSKRISFNTEDFITKAQKKHNNKDGTPKYTYDNVVYIANDKKVLITCPIHSPFHGDFPQRPSDHLQGNGCPWCKETKGEKRINQILYEKNIN